MVEIDFVTVLMKMVFPNALVDLEFYILANMKFPKFSYFCRKKNSFWKSCALIGSKRFFYSEIPKTYLKPCQVSTVELFAKVVAKIRYLRLQKLLDRILTVILEPNTVWKNLFS